MPIKENCHLFFSWNAFCSFTLNHFWYFRLFIGRLARGHLTFLQLEAQQPLSTIKIIGHCVSLLRILKLNWWAILLSFSWQKSVAAQGLLSLLPHFAHRAVFPNLECCLTFLQDICNSLNIRLSLDSIRKREESNSNCRSLIILCYKLFPLGYTHRAVQCKYQRGGALLGHNSTKLFHQSAFSSPPILVGTTGVL